MRASGARRRPGLAVAAALVAALTGCVVDNDPTADDQGPADPTTIVAPATPTTTVDPDTPSATPDPDAPTTSSDPVADGAYVDRDGFSIVFPSTWEIRTDVGGLQVVGLPPEQLAPDFADNVGVLLEDSGNESLTAQEYADASVQGAPNLIAEFVLVETTVSGDTATLEYTGTLGQPLHFLAITKIKDGKAFTATFSATEGTYVAGLEAAQTILASLRAT